MDNDKCTCPSGDGSLRWPCPAHATEAKSSASAAPGMEFPEAGVYVASLDGVARDSITDRVYEGDELYTPDQMRAAIAAAREEEFGKGFFTGYDHGMAQGAVEECARLAAPEGPVAITDEKALNGIKWYAAPPAEMRNGVNLYAAPQAKAPQQPPAGEDADQLALFRQWMSQWGESAVYMSDGLFEGSEANGKYEAWRAAVEANATLRRTPK